MWKFKNSQNKSVFQKPKQWLALWLGSSFTETCTMPERHAYIANILHLGLFDSQPEVHECRNY